MLKAIQNYIIRVSRMCTTHCVEYVYISVLLSVCKMSYIATNCITYGRAEIVIYMPYVQAYDLYDRTHIIHIYAHKF